MKRTPTWAPLGDGVQWIHRGTPEPDTPYDGPVLYYREVWNGAELEAELRLERTFLERPFEEQRYFGRRSGRRWRHPTALQRDRLNEIELKLVPLWSTALFAAGWKLVAPGCWRPASELKEV